MLNCVTVFLLGIDNVQSKTHAKVLPPTDVDSPNTNSIEMYSAANSNESPSSKTSMDEYNTLKQAQNRMSRANSHNSDAVSYFNGHISHNSVY